MRPATTTLFAALAILAMTEPASASNEALLIGKPPADRAGLTQLWTSLAQRFSFTDVRIAMAGSPHEVGERVRQFLAAPGNPDDRRLVWVSSASDGTDSVCPAFDEDFVRPRVPAILVAPACVKYLVQAPSTYEPLQAAGDVTAAAGVPGVLFIDTDDDAPAALAAVLKAPSQSDQGGGDGDAALQALIAALTCPAEASATTKVSVDYSPSSSAWRIAPPLCAEVKTPPPGDSAEAPPADGPPATEAAATESVAPESAAEAPPPVNASLADAAPTVAADAEPAPAPKLPMPPPARPIETAEVMPAVPLTPVSVTPAPPLPAQSVAAAPANSPLNSLAFASPVDGRVMSDFGAQVAGKANKGVDFAAAPGTAVKAAQSGEVVYVGELPGYGKVVAIKHGSDFATVYGHAADIKVAKGQIVEKGQDIAQVDPAKYLHFEVRRRGKPVDPRPMLASAGP